MNSAIIIMCVMGLCVLSLGTPRNVLSVRGDDFQMEQDRSDDHDDVVTGTYSWTSPDGRTFHVSYIADGDGFRVLDSNAVPVSIGGVRADGSQGSFLNYHDDSSDDDDDDDDDYDDSRDYDHFYDDK